MLCEPVSGSPDPMPTPTIDDVFDAWVDAQQLDATVPGAPVPMVVVMADGGGMRAADLGRRWSSDCIVGREVATKEDRACAGPRRSTEEAQSVARRIFLVSGVSGGSVGLAAYAENLLSEHPLEDGWVEASLGRDFASPTIGWGIFRRPPEPFLRSVVRVGGVPTTPREHLSPAGPSANARGVPRHSTENPPLLRTTWDQRWSLDAEVRAKAETAPLLVFKPPPCRGAGAQSSPRPRSSVRAA